MRHRVRVFSLHQGTADRNVCPTIGARADAAIRSLPRRERVWVRVSTLTRTVICWSIVVLLSWHGLAAQRGAAPTRENPDSREVQSAQEQTPASSQLVPALAAEELIAFCLKEKQTERRETSVRAVQTVFEGLRGENVKRGTAPNLLLNGDFEEWNGANPRCWNWYKDEKSLVSADAPAAKSGERSLRIDLLQGAGKVTIEQTVVVGRPYQLVELAGWTKQTGNVTFEVTISSGAPDGAWEELLKAESEPPEERVPRKDDWAREVVGIPGVRESSDGSTQPYQKIKVTLVVAGRGTLWLDDVSLTAISRPQAAKRRENWRKLAVQIGAASGWENPQGPTRYWFPSGHVFDASSNQPIEAAWVAGPQAIPVGNTGAFSATDRTVASTDRSGFFEAREPVTAPAILIGAEGYEMQAVSFEEGKEKDLTALLQRDEPTQEEQSRRKALETQRVETPRPKVWIAGYVRDAQTGKPVEGALIVPSPGGRRLETNSRGFFMIMDQVNLVWEGVVFNAHKSGYKEGSVEIRPDTTAVQDGRLIVNIDLVTSKK